MTNVPVGKTIAFSYGFTFGNIGTIIGQIWLPTLLLTLGSYYVLTPYYETMARAFAEDNTALMGQALAAMLFYMMMSLVLYAMIFAALTRTALGLEHGRGFLNLPLGAATWRMYGALLAFALVMAVLFVLTLLVAGLAGGLVMGLLGVSGAAKGAAAAANPVVAGVGLLISLFIVCTMLYVFVRLYFMLAPVTVAEEQVSLGRGWQLTAHNFWRLFVILLAVLGPMMLVIGLCELVLLGPDAMMAKSGATAAETAARMDALRSQLPLLHALSFVFSPVLFGLQISASAFVYRSLVPPGSEGRAIAV